MKKIIKKICPNKILLFWKRYRIKKHLQSSLESKLSIGQIDDHWKERISEAKSSSDNSKIKHVPEAGNLVGPYIIMHNGVKIFANSYYGSGMLNMLMENKGVHEPQEERVFEEVINFLPEECTMLELGAYWGFYSLSLLERHPLAKCFLVEPDPNNLYCGQLNFKLNKRKGYFHEAGVDKCTKRNPHMISVDDFCRDNNIKRLNILHADIQGHELSMLEGARNMLSMHKIDYLFISTHSTSLHDECMKYIVALDYETIASADLDETFSYDGLIVAKNPSLKNPSRIAISQRKRKK
jgi:hypothetical protein